MIIKVRTRSLASYAHPTRLKHTCIVSYLAQRRLTALRRLLHDMEVNQTGHGAYIFGRLAYPYIRSL